MFEVGYTYFWNGDNVTPCFLVSEDSGGAREYADSGFVMKYGDKHIQYAKNELCPAYKSKCTCICVSPLVFNVEKVESPLIDDEVKSKQREVVKKLLEEMMCSTSDLSVDAIAEVAIPWSHHDRLIAKEMVRNELTEYFKKDVGTEYQGSTQGYGTYESRLTAALTVVFGHRVAKAVMKLNDTYQVKVVPNENGVGYKALYKGMDISTFLDSVEDKLQRSSAEDIQQRFMKAADLM